jgi:hypothetical protein
MRLENTKRQPEAIACWGSEIYALCSQTVLANPDGVAHGCPSVWVEVKTVLAWHPGATEWMRLPDIPQGPLDDIPLFPSSPTSS